MSRILLGGKSGKIKQERSLELFCPLVGGGRANKSATFLCWGRRRPSRLALCEPSYWWSHINREEDCCWLLWIVFVVGGDEPSKVLDCQCRLPGILFLRVTFLQDQIVEPWQLTCCWLLGIDRAVPNAIDLILLVVASLKF